MAASRPTAPDPGPIETGVLQSRGSATWLTDADAGAFALAVELARALDAELDPQTARILTQLLTALGLTVAGRAEGSKAREEVDPLASIQERARLRLVDAAPPDPAPRTPDPAGRRRGAR